MLDRAVKMTRKGQNIKAAKLVENWMNRTPRNHAGDGFLYQQVAVLYIGEAEMNPATRSETVAAAETNLEKAVAAFEKEDPQRSDSSSIDLYEIGRGYEALGDLAGASRCHYYTEAGQLYARQLPMIQTDSITAYGKTIPLEPVRAEVRKHLDAVNDKLSKANCQRQ